MTTISYQYQRLFLSTVESGDLATFLYKYQRIWREQRAMHNIYNNSFLTK